MVIPRMRACVLRAGLLPAICPERPSVRRMVVHSGHRATFPPTAYECLRIAYLAGFGAIFLR